MAQPKSHMGANPWYYMCRAQLLFLAMFYLSVCLIAIRGKTCAGQGDH
jgi:hypothetical protein